MIKFINLYLHLLILKMEDKHRVGSLLILFYIFFINPVFIFQIYLFAEYYFKYIALKLLNHFKTLPTTC